MHKEHLMNANVLKKAVSFSILMLFNLSVLFINYSFGQISLVKGTVCDKQGNPLQNVRITLLDPARGTKFSIKSNKEGKFVKIGVPPSTYKIIVELEGYYPFELQYRVKLGAKEELKITLEKIPPKIEEDKDYADGINFFKQGKYKESIESFKKLVEKFPDDVDLMYNLGLSYLRNGNPDEAINKLHKAMGLNPDMIEIYLALGECYFKKGEKEKALESFSKAVEIQPDNPKTYYNIGIVHYKADRIEQAIKSFEKSIKLNPNFSSAYYQLGLGYIKAGDFKKAIESLEKFLKLEPGSPEANIVKEIIEKLKKQKT